MKAGSERSMRKQEAEVGSDCWLELGTPEELKKNYSIEKNSYLGIIY